MSRYFLSVTFAGEKIEREVSEEEFRRAERVAGFTSGLISGRVVKTAGRCFWKYITCGPTGDGDFWGTSCDGKTEVTYDEGLPKKCPKCKKKVVEE